MNDKDLIKQLREEVAMLRRRLGRVGRPVKHHIQPGEKIGAITAIQDLGRGEGLFKCFCNNVFPHKIFHIREGIVKSCGCVRGWPKGKPRGSPYTSYVGEIIGKMKTVELTTEGSAKFECRCGKIEEFRIEPVRKLRRQSCGCARLANKKSIAVPNNDPVELLAFHTVWPKVTT